ncbi:hypothetical protein BUALT_Bualt13G0020400 [Buddleja alternifolia]|uniref:Uncharacterized protein n=1 Tax=Buddleja alternifolia TaxID=168488 RepID=A0AAV6WV11_9LAMI|nr:hypothetical protein BUALT_Bualt13G0020400 [Buddleja alternifolia]
MEGSLYSRSGNLVDGKPGAASGDETLVLLFCLLIFLLTCTIPFPLLVQELARIKSEHNKSSSVIRAAESELTELNGAEMGGEKIF